MDRTERAGVLAATGRHAEALALQEEALAMVRVIAAQHPGDQRATQLLASILSSMGSSLTAIGRPDVAVAVLDECVRTYRELSRRGVAVRTLLADVHAGKGAAELARGYGATAVLELDSAVDTYLDPHPGTDDPHPLDLARVLALNASALRAHGDPDLAVASADAAIRLYRSYPDVTNGAPDALTHTRYLLLAANTAADIHGTHDRLASALEAGDFAVRAARAVVDALGTEQANRQQANREQANREQANREQANRELANRELANRELATALARKGVHLRAAGRGAAGDSLVEQGRAADAAAAAFVADEWDRVPAGTRPVTLAESLATADCVLGSGRVPEILAEALVRSAGGREILTPSMRCSPPVSPGYAAMLAGVATQLLPIAPAEGVRIGLEAHYLFAVASREQTMPMRHAYREFGFHWALVLLVCSRHYVDDDLPMALDLAGWADVAAMGLVPFLAGSPGLAALVRECLNHHADLYARNGETEAGADVLRVVRSLDDYDVS
ncbi:MAG TPA: tetratricopeptide repeat protein [Planosporangium sp.]|jgi:tetratricopeptide (TPR) repeat protein|nr:tetratricopeptide repeat protein [Planosporangium sp.]